MWKLGWELQPGVTSTQAVADAFVGELNYEMGCTVACQLIMAQGILDFHKNVKKDEPTSNHLNLITAESPLDSMEPRTASRNAITKVSEGTLLDRHFNVPHNNWVPGDWGWIMNPDHASSEVSGYEGANIVYIGRGLFVVYYDSDPDRTLDQALVRVYKWRDASLRQPITPELVEQLRKDPRHGGLLRDVRDFPKNISLPSK